MKKIIIIMILSLFLSGCGQKVSQNYDIDLEELYKNEEYDEPKEETNTKPSDNTSTSKGDTNSKPSSNATTSKGDTNSKPSSSTTTSKGDTNSKTSSNATTSKDNTSSKPSISTTPSKDNTPSVNDKVSYSTKDIKAINSMENINKEVDNLLNEGSSQSTKDKAKGVFITLVDFVFYDGEINGVTFNELTDSGKAKVLELINTIDEKIEKHFPGYKETISSKTSEAFQKASDLIKKGAKNISDFAQEKLGEENYQEIIDAKDELVTYTKNALSLFGNVGSNLFSKAKDKLSNWYENFKNNN